MYSFTSSDSVHSEYYEHNVAYSGSDYHEHPVAYTEHVAFPGPPNSVYSDAYVYPAAAHSDFDAYVDPHAYSNAITYDALCYQYPNEDVPYVPNFEQLHVLPEFHGLTAADHEAYVANIYNIGHPPPCEPTLEELVKQMAMQNLEFMQETRASLQELSNQLEQMSSSMNTMQSEIIIPTNVVEPTIVNPIPLWLQKEIEMLTQDPDLEVVETDENASKRKRPILEEVEEHSDFHGNDLIVECNDEHVFDLVHDSDCPLLKDSYTCHACTDSKMCISCINAYLDDLDAAVHVNDVKELDCTNLFGAEYIPATESPSVLQANVLKLNCANLEDHEELPNIIPISLGDYQEDKTRKRRKSYNRNLPLSNEFVWPVVEFDFLPP